MDQLIIYKQDNGNIAVVCPAPEYLNTYGIKKIAARDVPAGKPYKIVDRSFLPQDKDQRKLLVMDDSEFNDGFGVGY
jgi:hypothetical protein